MGLKTKYPFNITDWTIEYKDKLYDCGEVILKTSVMYQCKNQWDNLNVV